MAAKKSLKKFTDNELKAASARSMRAYENPTGSLTKAQRFSASDSLGMVQKEQSRRAQAAKRKGA